MRVIADKSRCIAAGQCVMQSPKVFDQDQDDGMVIVLHEHPALSNVAAAARLDLHPNSIRLWRQRWAKGQFTLEDAPGRGRKPVFSPP